MMAPDRALKVPASRVPTVLTYHTNPEAAGRVFSQVQPKVAVYTHLILPGGGGTPPPTPDHLIAATRATYDGPVVASADLDRSSAAKTASSSSTSMRWSNATKRKFRSRALREAELMQLALALRSEVHAAAVAPPRILRPGSLPEAAELAARLGSQARIVAGATALQLEWRHGVRPPPYLIDLMGLTELTGIGETTGGVLRIGASTRLRALEEVVAQRLPLLATTINRTAAPGVRQLATIGGNIAAGTGCLIPTLLALGASVEFFDGGALRVLPLPRWLSTAPTRKGNHRLDPGATTPSAPSHHTPQDRTSRRFHPQRYRSRRHPCARFAGSHHACAFCCRRRDRIPAVSRSHRDESRRAVHPIDRLDAVARPPRRGD